MAKKKLYLERLHKGVMIRPDIGWFSAELFYRLLGFRFRKGETYARVELKGKRVWRVKKEE